MYWSHVTYSLIDKIALTFMVLCIIDILIYAQEASSNSSSLAEVLLFYFILNFLVFYALFWVRTKNKTRYEPMCYYDTLTTKQYPHFVTSMRSTACQIHDHQIYLLERKSVHRPNGCDHFSVYDNMYTYNGTLLPGLVLELMFQKFIEVASRPTFFL